MERFPWNGSALSKLPDEKLAIAPAKLMSQGQQQTALYEECSNAGPEVNR